MNNQRKAHDEQAHSESDSKEFLTFVLGDEHYALDIMSVKEIRGYEAVTKIANAPAFIKGVMNLRGDIVPIVILVNIERLISSDELGLLDTQISASLE